MSLLRLHTQHGCTMWSSLGSTAKQKPGWVSMQSLNVDATMQVWHHFLSALASFSDQVVR